MKDVTSCEKPRAGANTRPPADVRMGKPGGSDPATARCAGRTRGTETSQYPQEEKVRTIAQVVASERAGAHTGAVKAAPGVVGPPAKAGGEGSGTGWKAWPERVTAPYAKPDPPPRRHLSTAEHEEFCGNRRGPSRKAKHYRETDSEQVP